VLPVLLKPCGANYKSNKAKKIPLFSAQLCPELRKPRCGLSQSSFKQEVELELPA